MKPCFLFAVKLIARTKAIVRGILVVVGYTALIVVSKSIVIAYGRANYGETILASRSMDGFYILSSPPFSQRRGLENCGADVSHFGTECCRRSFLPASFFFGLCRIAQIVVEDLLVPTRMMNLVAEERVQTFMKAGNEQDLFEGRLVCWPPLLLSG
jgi:hypothetical protein